MTYTPAVTKQRDAILRGRSIREIARLAEIADSQIVRLFNGHSRRPSYKQVRNLASALGYKSSDAFFDDLSSLWKSLDRANR